MNKDTAGERMNVGTLEAAESFLGAVWELYGPDCPDLLSHLGLVWGLGFRV